MDSLTLKIQSFVNQVDSPATAGNVSSDSALKMVKYFEEEYDLQMMSFLENEWVEEQVDRDVTHGEFSELNAEIPTSRQASFESAVASIWE